MLRKTFWCKKEYVCADIKNAKSQIPSHDLLVGGFPCQDYSIAKRNPQGIEGKKGILWWEIDSILYEHRPAYVLLENVDRLIVSPAWQRGRDFSIMLRCFYEKGYAVEWRVINAADYGFPQRRRRTFIFAYHNDTQLFRNAADDICIRGLKGAHKQVTRDGFSHRYFHFLHIVRPIPRDGLMNLHFLICKSFRILKEADFTIQV